MKAIPRQWLYLAGALVVGLVLTRVRVRPLTVLGVLMVVVVLLYGGQRLLTRVRHGGGVAAAAGSAPALDPAPPGPGPALGATPVRTFLEGHARRLVRVAAGCLGLAVVAAAAAAAAYLVTDADRRPGWSAVVLGLLTLVALGAAVLALTGLAQCHRARRRLRRSPWRAVAAQGPVRRGRTRGAAAVDAGPVRLRVGSGEPATVRVRAFVFADVDGVPLVAADGARSTLWYVGDDLGNGLVARPGGSQLRRTRAVTG